MPNSFTITVNKEPVQVYLMSHTLMTVEYMGKKHLLILRPHDENHWKCLSGKLEEIEQIGEAIEQYIAP